MQMSYASKSIFALSLWKKQQDIGATHCWKWFHLIMELAENGLISVRLMTSSPAVPQTWASCYCRVTTLHQPLHCWSWANKLISCVSVPPTWPQGETTKHKVTEVCGSNVQAIQCRFHSLFSSLRAMNVGLQSQCIYFWQTKCRSYTKIV